MIPLAEARAGAALGRTVTIESLDVDPGRVTRVDLGGFVGGGAVAVNLDLARAVLVRLSGLQFGNAPIRITGAFKSPEIAPGAEAVARGDLAALLGTVLTPLAALIPTIQLGVGEDTDCGELIHRVTTEPLTRPASPPAR